MLYHKLNHMESAAPVEYPSPHAALTLLHGRRLVVARLVWLGLATATIGVFIASLPAYHLILQTLCTSSPCAFGQISGQTAHTLRQLGVSLDGYAMANVAVTIVLSCVWFVVAGVLFWRRSADLMALITALFLVVAGCFTIVETFATSHSAWRVAAQGLGAAYFVLFSLLASLFPSGRFVPRWTRWLVTAYSVVICGGAVLTPNPYALPPWLGAAIGSLLLGFALAFAWAQVYRYRHVSTPIERQQTKVIVFGVAVALAVSLSGFVPSILFPESLFTLIYRPMQSIGLLLVPITMAVAILRYHLWEVDSFINKALVYGTLTATLGALYVGLILGLTHVGSLLSGSALQQPLALAVSTLVVAALFQPARRHYQRLIDQHFYRARYDAERIVSAFRTAQRNTIELEDLCAELVAVVRETMQPAHVSLWLWRPLQRTGDSGAKADSGHAG